MSNDLFEKSTKTICKNCESYYLEQRTAAHHAIAKWQREYMEMKLERDAIAQLLKMHHDARSKVTS